jgi:uncharacterized protein YjgD (DUF1641 family)
MNLDQRRAQGQATVVAVVNAVLESDQALAGAISELTDEQARSGLALLAEQHANATRGGARYLPEEGISELVLDAVDEAGFGGAVEIVDAFSDGDVRAALGNLVVAARTQRQTIDRLNPPDPEAETDD